MTAQACHHNHDDQQRQTAEGSMTRNRLAFGFLHCAMLDIRFWTAGVQLPADKADAHGGRPARGDQGILAPLASD
jgi:hypothetical protein